MRFLFVRMIATIASVFGAAALAADIPAPIGLDIRLVTAKSGADISPVSIDTAARSALREAVAEAEVTQAQLGPYDPTLSTIWLSLANRALTLGDQEQAAVLFQRAIHNLRLNEGLTSLTQMDALDSWIGNLRQRGDSDALNNILTYRYRLVGFGGEPWNGERVAYATDFLDQKLFELTQGSWINRERDILWLLDHLSNTTDSACFEPDSSIEWCRPLAKRYLAFLYLVEHRVDPFVQDQRDIYLPPPRALRDQSLTYRLEYEESRASREGTRLLKRLEELAEEDNEVSLLHADWQWMHKRNLDAIRRYQSIWEQAPELLKEAVPLPWGLGALQSSRVWNEERPSALLSFTVSEQGRPRNIVGVDADNRSEQRIRRALRQLKFRPAFADGVRIESQQTQRFELLDP
jgi:hypothetical protein